MPRHNCLWWIITRNPVLCALQNHSARCRTWLGRWVGTLSPRIVLIRQACYVLSPDHYRGRTRSRAKPFARKPLITVTFHLRWYLPTFKCYRLDIYIFFTFIIHRVSRDQKKSNASCSFTSRINTFANLYPPSHILSNRFSNILWCSGTKYHPVLSLDPTVDNLIDVRLICVRTCASIPLSVNI